MSYCRFENTSADLTDCGEAMDAMLSKTANEDGERSLSRSEKEAAICLAQKAFDLLAMLAEAQGVAFSDMSYDHIRDVIERKNDEAALLDEQDKDSADAFDAEQAGR